MGATADKAKARAERDQAKLDAMMSREFPPALLDPWQTRAKKDAPGWFAYMRPMVSSLDGQPIWTLTRAFGESPHTGGLQTELVIAGKDQDVVIAAAARHA